MQTDNQRGMQTVFDKIIPEHCEKVFFTNRVTELKKLQEKNTQHMFNIATTQLRKYPIIIYKQKSEYLLSDLIEKKQELLPTEIKSIIWQITKIMLQCQKMNISHLRLFPKSIVLNKNYKQGEHIYVKIKDFSMGKEYNQVSEGKHLQFFQFLHPKLSVMNEMIDFKTCFPRYDIWSLGIILYYLIYGLSPFCKQKKVIFSKTILRQYQKKDYQILFTNDKYKSINIFIAKCLQLQNDGEFSNWNQVKKYILDKQQIYNELDFHNQNFQEICELYIRLMIFLSGIYCLINEQFQSGSHQFWGKNIGLKNGLCQFTLMFMKLMRRRFQTIYSSYFFLITQEALNTKIKQISDCLDNEIQCFGQSRFQLVFWTTNTFTVEAIKKVQEICMKVKLQISELNQMPYARRTMNSRNSFLERKIWKSIQTLYDYIDEVLFILNMCKTRSKTIYEQFFISEAFTAILMEDFGYKPNDKLDVRHFMANIVN